MEFQDEVFADVGNLPCEAVSCREGNVSDNEVLRPLAPHRSTRGRNNIVCAKRNPRDPVGTSRDALCDRAQEPRQARLALEPWPIVCERIDDEHELVVMFRRRARWERRAAAAKWNVKSIEHDHVRTAECVRVTQLSGCRERELVGVEEDDPIGIGLRKQLEVRSFPLLMARVLSQLEVPESSSRAIALENISRPVGRLDVAHHHEIDTDREEMLECARDQVGLILDAEAHDDLHRDNQVRTSGTKPSSQAGRSAASRTRSLRSAVASVSHGRERKAVD